MGLNPGQEAAATPLAKRKIQSISRQIATYISSVSDNTDKTLIYQDKTLVGSEASSIKDPKLGKKQILRI